MSERRIWFEVFGVSEGRDSVALMRGLHFHRR